MFNYLMPFISSISTSEWLYDGDLAECAEMIDLISSSNSN